MKHIGLVLIASLAATAVPAAAQLHLLGRTDKGGVLYSVNKPNGMPRLEALAKEKGGTWQILLQSNECGWAAVSTAFDGSTRRYFVAVGKETGRDANREALELGEAYVRGRKGWYAQLALLGIYNENKHSILPGTNLNAPPGMQGIKPCPPKAKP